jgi:porphobilinogen synthase
MTHFGGSFPQVRLRRTRQHAWSRDLVAETSLGVDDLILPLFVSDGPAEVSAGEKASLDLPCAPLDGLERFVCEQVIPSGVRAVMLFPLVPAPLKDQEGRYALKSDGIVPQALCCLKRCAPDLGRIVDVALDPYTSHGHDGLMKDGMVLNDETSEVLAQMACLYAANGADCIAPSDMMDGRVGVIRHALEDAGHLNTMIMAYTAKYASAFYGPFRDVMGVQHHTKGFHKKMYQMDVRNHSEALREAACDVQEGADLLIVKPGGLCLDVLAALSREALIPLVAYQVSGEFAMLRAASKMGWLSYEKALLESVVVMKRAGASVIITYGALDLARLLRGASGA